MVPLVFRAPRVLCWAGLLGVPVGGGPPASRPRRALLLVAPRVFWAPSGPAAREIATREPKGSEWSISRPALALRTLRRPSHQWRLFAGGWFGAFSALALRPPTGTAARPSGPSGTLHTGGACVAVRG